MKRIPPRSRARSRAQVRAARRWRDQIVRAILAVGLSAPATLPAADASVPDLTAAPKPNVDLTEVPLEELMGLKVQSVYAASRHEQRISEAPANVTVINSDEIKKYGYRSFTDILRSVPGMYVTSDRNYSYLGVRGFNRPGDFVSRVLLQVNGHRMNENVFDGAVIGQAFPIDVDLIDRVEVIRGPGSSIYGNNAFFAVINVITKNGRDFQGGEVSGATGSFGTYEGQFSYGRRFTNGVEFLLSGTYYNSDGPAKLYYPEFDTPANNYGVTRHTDYETLYSFFGNVAYSDFKLEGTFSSRDKGIPTGSYGTIFGDDRAKTVNDRGYANLSFNHTFENHLQLTANVFYDTFDYEGDYPLDYGTHTSVYDDYGRGRLWGADVQAIQQFFDDRVTLTVGSVYHDNLAQDQGAGEDNPPATYLEDHRRTMDFAFYGQGEFQILTNLIFNAGLRYDNFETFGDTVNPRLGLIYSPVPTTTFKALYGTAFKAPNAYELYYAGPSNKGNLDLEPEDITTYELVYEQRLGKYFKLVSSGFYYHINNLINQETDPSDNLLVYRNSERAKAFGVETALETKLPGGLMGRVSYSYQETNDEEQDTRLSNSPRHLGKLNLSVPLWKDKIFSGIELQYHGDVKSLNDRTINDYVLVNLTLYSQKIAKNLDASISVYNVFDQRYYHPGAGEHLTQGMYRIEQDGITWWLKFNYRF